jgi:hypothetical protein
MLYVYTIDGLYAPVVKSYFKIWKGKKNMLLFEYANQPAIPADGSSPKITLSQLSSLEGDWALIVPTDVLPHLEQSSIWSKCKMVKHVNDIMREFTAFVEFI